MKATTIPVVIGALGQIKKGWRNTYNRFRVTSKHMNNRRSHYLEHPRKDTLALGPGIGLG